jgi:hypothetical protein
METREKQAALIHRLLTEARKAASIAEEAIEEPSGTIADLDDQEYSSAYSLMRYAEGQVWALEWLAGIGPDMTPTEEGEAIHYLVRQGDEKNQDRLALGTTEASARLEMLACLDGYDPESPDGGHYSIERWYQYRYYCGMIDALRDLARILGIDI